MSGGKRFKERSLDRKKIYYVAGIGAFIALLIFIMILSGYKAKNDANARIAELENTEAFDATMVSYSEDKGINEVENENSVDNEIVEEKIAINTSNLPENVLNVTETSVNTEIEEDKPVELHFSVPVEGEISKDFSDSSLIFSETLQEWTVHLGVDIKAERGMAVNSCEAGMVESIKNDPRYGLTVTVAHANGYKTIYSNLQTAEFVSEGQKIEKGQLLGSVGDNAPFEIADEPHLHFEMTLNGENVNPALYFENETE